jgi:CHAT domain-containing protein
VQARRQEPGDAGEALVLSYDLAEGRREAQAVARVYRVQPLLDDTASETLLRARAGEAGILHVASHGILETANPLFSRVLLAPDTENDGALEVHEVYSLDLRGTGMVVLSACETNLGILTGGDDLVGLTRAFIYAGTPSVVASLWRVEEEATRLFMESFYRHLHQGKMKAEALQAAQQELRSQYAAPYYWAGFVLTGDPGPLTVRMGTETGGDRAPEPAIAIAATAIILCIAGGGGYLLYWRRRSERPTP